MLRIAFLAIFALVVSGCGTDSTSTENGHDHDHEGHDHGSDGHGTDDHTYSSAMCQAAESLDPLAMEYAEAGTNFSAAIQMLSPSWPAQEPNTWSLVITDATGATRDDVTASLRPWMPTHGHGVSPLDYTGTAQGADGVYEFEAFTLSMAGVWEVTVTVTDATDSSIEEELVFRFCVDP